MSRVEREYARSGETPRVGVLQKKKPDSVGRLDRAQAVKIILDAREPEHFLRNALFHEVSMNVNDEGA